MTTVRFYQQSDGEWVQPKRGFRMKCCDCGLVHRMEFRVRARRVQFRAFRVRRRKKSQERLWIAQS